MCHNICIQTGDLHEKITPKVDIWSTQIWFPNVDLILLKLIMIRLIIPLIETSLYPYPLSNTLKQWLFEPALTLL